MQTPTWLHIEDNNHKLEELSVKHPTISLSSDEKCLFEGAAEAVHSKNVVVGRNSVHLGSGKGGLYSSVGQSTNIRGDVQERYKGKFYLTTKRFVMVAAKYGFDIPVNQISSLNLYSDGLMVTQNSKSYLVATKDISKIRMIIETSNKIEAANNKLNEQNDDPSPTSEHTSAPSNNSSNITSTADEIREFKKLLDEGIISQEEFDLKKRQLLGI